MNYSVLGAVALGFAPLIDRQRMVVATQLTLMPLRPDARLDSAEVLAAVAEVWPAGGGQLILNVLNEALLQELLQAPLPAHIWLEVPSFMSSDPALAEPLAALKKAGSHLLLKGLPSQALTPELNACFKNALLDLDEQGRGAATHSLPKLPLLLSGVRSAADIDAAFQRNAEGVIGWPMQGAFEPLPGAAKNEIQADLQVIVELMSRVDQNEDIERLEQTLKRDPSLAFKLLRYLNSAAFGLAVEVSSFRHAIMLLGYPRLKRWLALLLTTASKDHSMRPIMFAALRRGLLMEELAKSMSDSELRDEMFICGLFSLLDHMLKQPFTKLLQSIPMPERVRQALVDESGPYQPYLELVRAIEQASVYDYRAAAEGLMLDAGEINQCVLRALSKAAQLE
ncbi:EAL and modified HD-GYP domain-containing signal transduction protein [Paucibacter oligotrophus]|uniref:EAL and modified HD-GYP domain-containing signal transduction protein n=1 Tax=Roseateles oligotrophus TaxID=1769250 RepID=A0A840LA07_9BURK|nr:HDOD domain-containing protein [Roseateles oligotrophus]MBB4843595.1 EAL and modified HD-GYP domain-containing signal transduction protein [Roseateles oligotrophus]